MRTKSELQQELKNALTSQNWKRLMTGLIGQELISFGTEVLYLNESFVQTLINNFNPNYTDLDSLIVLATANNIAVDITRPSYIRATIPSASDSVTLPSVFKPFDLVIKSGSYSYTNIDYCKPGDTVTFYQGMVYSYTDSSDLDSSDFLGYRYDQKGTLSLSYIPASDTSVTSIYKLGSVYVPSVYFIKRNEGTGGVTYSSIIPQFSPLEVLSTKECYKLRTLADSSTVIVLGDNNWGAAPSGVGYQAVWLSPTVYDVTEAETYALQYYDGSALQSIGNATFVAAFTGESDSIEVARISYNNQVLEQVSLISLTQIREYVNTFAFVLDSYVESPEVGKVVIYWKPTDADETNPSDLGDEDSYPSEVLMKLYTHSPMCTTYTMRIGESVTLRFAISSSSLTESSTLSDQITELIRTEYAYANLAYSDSVTASTVAALIQTTFGYNVLVSFHYSESVEEVSAVSVPMTIIPGSVTFTSTSGDVYTDNGLGVLLSSDKTTVVGSVSYDDGEVTFTSSVSGELEVRSYETKISAEKYIVIDESNPVVWL